MRTIYYVDAENVGAALIQMLSEALIDKSVFSIFYTNNMSKLNMEDLSLLDKHKIKVRYIRCHTGKNALDFQLISTLGYSIAKAGRKCQYIIISNDTGYDTAIKYWVGYGYSVRRVPIITESSSDKVNSEETDKESSERERMYAALRKRGVTDGECLVVYNAFVNHKSEDLQHRMSNIRCDIFDRFPLEQSNTLWRRCHKYLKEL